MQRGIKCLVSDFIKIKSANENSAELLQNLSNPNVICVDKHNTETQQYRMQASILTCSF